MVTRRWARFSNLTHKKIPRLFSGLNLVLIWHLEFWHATNRHGRLKRETGSDTETNRQCCVHVQTNRRDKRSEEKAPVRQTVIILSSKAVVVHVTPKSFVSRFVIVMPSWRIMPPPLLYFCIHGLLGSLLVRKPWDQGIKLISDISRVVASALSSVHFLPLGDMQYQILQSYFIVLV